MQKKAEAYKEYREAAMIEMLLETLPKVAAEVAAPLSQVSVEHLLVIIIRREEPPKEPATGKTYSALIMTMTFLFSIALKFTTIFNYRQRRSQWSLQATARSVQPN